MTDTLKDIPKDIPKDIVILGGGFAGLSAAGVAADENDKAGGDLRITLVSPSEYITIRPRLYERDPETLRAPLRPALDPIGVRFVEQAAESIDTAAKTVTLADGTALSYDALILATGSELAGLPLPGAAEHTRNIDSYDGAVAFDAHLKDVLKTPDAPGHDTFVIVGAGMTGIELAAEMRIRIAHHAGEAVAGAAKVILLEKADAVGPEFGVNPRPVIEQALAGAGVETRTGCAVAAFDADGVALADGSRIDAATVVMTVGMKANGLAGQIPAECDAMGRLLVDDHQRVIGVEGVYATGDVARARVDDENVALMSCQHARTMGKYAGYNAAHDLLGLAPILYRQPDYTTCLDLGDFGAVFTKGWDREVATVGPEAKKRKTMINCEWIYPPSGTKEEVFAGLRIDERGR